MANVKDDIGFDARGNPVAIGQDAHDQQNRIVDHPDATPVLVVAMLDGDIGVRVYGPPSEEIADLLDTISIQYRRAVVASQQRP